MLTDHSSCQAKARNDWNPRHEALGRNSTRAPSIVAPLVLLWCSAATASTIVDARVVRNQAGSGPVLISSGFPLPPGLVTESMVTEGSIKIVVQGSEIPAHVSALRGRHSDGTLRSVLIQFTTSMAQGTWQTAQVIFDGGARTNADPAYLRPSLTTVQNNNVILPADPSYLVSTMVTFQGLLPAGGGTAEEEKQYTALADATFTELVSTQNTGTASYEEVRGMLSLWVKTGDLRYFNHAVDYTLSTWLPADTQPPADNAGRPCRADAVVNPDGRPTSRTVCGGNGEQWVPRTFGYAAMYLLTGYRDFWGIVASIAQSQQFDIIDQAAANSKVIPYSGYDTPRTNYSFEYGGLLAAYMIEATIPVDGSWNKGRRYNWTQQLEWTLNAIKQNEWNFRWIPFDNGFGEVPAVGTAITQGGVSAELLGVYAQRFDPIVRAAQPMPTSGYVMVGPVTGGSFSAGALTGIPATATGPDETDYRMGLVGTRSNSPRQVNNPPHTQIPSFQLVFPTNFLIDYYLYVRRDVRIPAMVKKNLDVLLLQMRSLRLGDGGYGLTGGAWGIPVFGKPYPLENPISAAKANCWELPEYPRLVAFVLKTLGDDTVNGASYPTWYSHLIDTANNAPVNIMAPYQWKLFGQFFGSASDTPWIAAQSALPVPSLREPTYYGAIPGDVPDLQREGTVASPDAATASPDAAMAEADAAMAGADAAPASGDAQATLEADAGARDADEGHSAVSSACGCATSGTGPILLGLFSLIAVLRIGRRGV